MGKWHQQQSNPPSKEGNGNGDGATGSDPLSGSTLEDYFASHKTKGQVSQHLLNGTDGDVMAVEKLKSSEDIIDGDKEVEGLISEQKSEQEEYEDDYESDSKEASDVAGMTLSDYLHVKDEDAEEKISRAGSLRMVPPQLASAKKVVPILDVSGMSLDHYLGTEEADKKPSPKVKRKGTKAKQTGSGLSQAKPSQPSFTLKGNNLTHMPQPNPNSQNLSSDEESSSNSPSSSLTPFQRRQKRKDRAKQKLLQRNGGCGSSVSKSILMADAAVSPSMGLPVRDKEKDKRKTSLGTFNHPHHTVHHGSHPPAPNFQPPLPKLAPSPSARTLHHKDHDASGNLSHDDNGDEKLPPL